MLGSVLAPVKRVLSNTAVARRLYDALAKRDGAALLSVLHPSFVGVVSAGMPLGVGGRHEGADAMLAEVWAPVFSAYDVEPRPDELIPAGADRVVAIGTYRGTERATGMPVNAAFVHVLRIDDGRVRELVQVTDTASWPTCSAPEDKEWRPTT
jgi:ketosteroid isomerase-like protein